MERNDTVILKLDRPRELRFSHKSMKRWSAYTGKAVGSIDTDSFGPEELEILLFFMLERDAKDNGETLDLAQMEELLDLAPIGTVYAALNAAMQAAFPEQHLGAAQKNGARAADGTGQTV